jgi:uncharacterized protein (TIGR03067 family)
MKRIALVACVLLGSRGWADDQKGDPGKELEGEWVLERIDLGKGAPKGEQELAEKRLVGHVRWSFHGGKLLATSPTDPGGKGRQSSYRVAAAATTKGIYLTLLDGDDKGKEFPLGIYRLDADRLAACVNTHKAATRLPAKFEPSEKDEASGDATAVLTFKRVKGKE